jgi:hypothetical protein
MLNRKIVLAALNGMLPQSALKIHFQIRLSDESLSLSFQRRSLEFV